MSCLQIQVHKTILSLSMPEFDWLNNISWLSSIPEPVLSTLLHYVYSHTLPPTLCGAVAQSCVECFQEKPEMSKLLKLCSSFIHNTILRYELQSLVTRIHSSLENMISMFETRDEFLNPARLWQNFKLCLRYAFSQVGQLYCQYSTFTFHNHSDGAVLVMRFVQLCVAYERHKEKLSADERQEVLEYFRSCLPVFALQIYRLLKCLKGVFENLSPSQNFALASSISPDVKILFILQSRSMHLSC